MMSLGASQSDVSAVYSLVALISDPKGCVKRMEELNALIKAAEEAQAAAAKVISEAQSAKQESEQSRIESERVGRTALDLKAKADKEMQSVITARTKMEEYEASIQERSSIRERQINDLSAALDAREKAFSASVSATEEAMKSREKAVSEREKQIDAAMSRAASLKDEYDTKLITLRKMIA